MPKVNLLQGVDAFLIEKAKNNDRDFSHFHPSSWDECIRKTAYQYYESKGIVVVKDEALKIDPQLERIFDNGHYVHHRWTHYLENAVPGALHGRWKCRNWQVHKEPRIFGLDQKLGCPKPLKCECGSTQFEYIEVGFYDEETMWGGHVDAIVNVEKWNEAILNKKMNLGGDKFIAVGISEYPVPDDDSLAVFDYKSMNHHQFSKLEEPLDKHRTQLQVYLYLSGLPSGKFLYENKGNQQVKEFLVERDDEFLEKKRLEAINLKYIVLNTDSHGKRKLPHRPKNENGTEKFSVGDKLCLQCKYRGHCWRDVLGK